METYRKQVLRSMTLDELASLLQSRHGVSVDVMASRRDDLIERILALQGASQEAGGGESDDEEGRPPPSPTGARARIVIHKSADIDGKDPVKVAVNGDPRLTFLIKRDVQVEVPLEVLNVLDHAEFTQYVPYVENGQTKVREERVRRFAYTRLA